MLYLIDDPERFKKENWRNWRKNTSFWLEGRMQHVRDISSQMGVLLRELVESERSTSIPTLVDLGCGDGWLLRLIEASQLPLQYVGIDFNPDFVKALSARHSYNKSARFVFADIEAETPSELEAAADIVINCFNFFEIPNIDSAFRNACRLLRPKGVMLIVTIDPIMQILSVSETPQEFKANLVLYEQHQANLGYDKDADIGEEKSGHTYRGVLHSLATYAGLAKEAGMDMLDLKEVIKTANRVPQIYQFLVLTKNG